MAEDTTIRDRLALQRTELANERTVLSYVRTALALVAAGASAIHFLDGIVSTAVGVFLMWSGCSSRPWGCGGTVATPSASASRRRDPRGWLRLAWGRSRAGPW